MVLGMKSKQKKGGGVVKLDYIVHLQDISPWPPSEGFKSVQTVLLQWENADRNSSGSFLSVAGDFDVTFNESFMLPLTLKRHKRSPHRFRKNRLELTLSEPPRPDRPKGHVLGTAAVDLADYVPLEEMVAVSVPINMKHSGNSSSSSVQPALSMKLEPVEKRDSSSSSSPATGSLSKDAPLWENGDSELASPSDEDDASSSHSSRRSSESAPLAAAASSSSPLNEKTGESKELSKNLLPDPPGYAAWKKKSNNNNNSHVSSSSSSKFPDRSMSFAQRSSIRSSPSSMSFRDVHNTVTDFKEDKSFVSFATLIGYGERTTDTVNNNSNASFDSSSSELKTASREDKTEHKDFESDGSSCSISLGKLPAIPPSRGRSKQTKSVQVDVSVTEDPDAEVKTIEVDIPNVSGDKKEPAAPHVLPDHSRNEWKARVEMLQEELREAAAIELALYATVSEHSSSGNKVHAPARRLSRFYSNACGGGCQAKRACAAKAAVSGLVLVSRACGHDVPRLTFWLSNAIMLRALISQTAAELPYAASEGEKSKPLEESDDWEDILAFIIALEKVESWLFSRIVESLWWQPAVVKNSVSTSAKTISKKSSGRKSNTGGCQEQGSLSIEIWKKAFKDACERLCPIRASGHECGCLAALVALVMEQLVIRLDVAMFNAILRESDEEMPTDPVSDPISDSKVLPIPAGKSSFTAGAQLKNVVSIHQNPSFLKSLQFFFFHFIGNWSRWLTDLFGLEDNSSEDSRDGVTRKRFKTFRLLHALSDLMMLPFGMLADASTRKEASSSRKNTNLSSRCFFICFCSHMKVCPLLGPAIIRRVLNNFIPDEFCPETIPRYVVEALDSEETTDSPADAVLNFPCSATPTRYSPPPAALLTCVGEVGSQVLKSSRLSSIKKSYNSDEELEELDSPLISIIPDSYQSSSVLAKLNLMPQEKHGRNIVRYKLLKEIWKDED
ncbi:hypothetical protein M569_02605, partial [Genlisea aurea]